MTRSTTAHAAICGRALAASTQPRRVHREAVSSSLERCACGCASEATTLTAELHRCQTGWAQPAWHRCSTAVSVVASEAHPRAHLSKLLLTASRWTRQGCVDAARAQVESAAWAAVLHAMRCGGACTPCPAGLASVEYHSKCGGFSRASTTTPLQAAAHGFSMHTSVLGGCWQGTATDGSVGCRAARH